jgi:dienelactone hydrolase
MRSPLPRLVLAAALCWSARANAQQRTFPFSLAFGPNRVGYRSVVLYDRSRSIPRDTLDAAGSLVRTVRPRPIHLSVWYPAVPSGAPLMHYRDYLALYGASLEVPDRSDSASRVAERRLLQWHDLLIRNPGVSIASRTDSLRRAIEREGAALTHATRDLTPDGRAHPIVISAAGAEGPSFENDVLMECLASRGYVAIGVPQWTEDGGVLQTTAAALETQARDIELALQYARELRLEAQQPAAVMGWSWSGFAAIVVAARNQSVSAVVSMDGSERYYWHDAALRRKVDNARPYTTPSLFIDQGSTPATLIASIGGDTVFTFYDSLRYADAYHVMMKDLRHQNFAALYNRLAGPQPNFFVSDPRVASAGYSTIAAYVVDFLDAYLRHDTHARQRLTLTGAQRADRDTNTTVEWKEGRRPLPTMAGFQAALGANGWQEAPAVLARLRAADPRYTLSDDALDDVGSAFLDARRVGEAVGAYRVYTTLYPGDAGGWTQLAGAYVAAHDTTNAYRSYEKALQIEPTNAAAAAGMKQIGKTPRPE